jgi:hypothetical protein
LSLVRIPFPERIPLNRVAIFAVVLFLIQQLEHTALYFSIGCAAFILIATFAFNAAGGLTRASGAYVFFYSTLVVILGLCYKAYLGEPAQSNLEDPSTTIKAYVGSIAAMLAAVIVSRRFSRKSGLLQHMLKESEMFSSSVGCIAFGVAAPILLRLLGDSASGLRSAFAQLNQLIPLGIIIGVMYEIRRSGGSRSVNLPVLLAVGYFFLLGIAGFSKQGILTPFYCLLLPMCALRHRLSLLTVASSVVFAFLTFYYLVPFAQYGRSLRVPGATWSQQLVIALPLLEHPEQTRRLYEATQEGVRGGGGVYFNTPQGFWDRLQFISVDDQLIGFTDRGHILGLAPLEESFVNAVPHFIWPNKPHPKLGGNFYAREMNIEAETGGDEDTTTGISFSPTSEAYHMAGWVGVLVIAPLLWFLFFVVFDSLFGDLRTTPWGLLALVLISHTAPEGALSGLIYLLTFGAEILAFCALFATFVAPPLGVLLVGSARRPSLLGSWNGRRLAAHTGTEAE